MNKLAATLAAGMLASTAAFAQSTGAGSGATSAMSTNDFVAVAAAGGQFEVEAGKLAEQKARNPQVKKFGRRMVTDHSKAGRQLETVLRSDKDVAKPNADQLPSDLSNQLSQLQNASRADFDKTYVAMMVDDHRKDAQKFQDYAKTGDDPKIRKFARQTLAVIRKHLSMITRIDQKMSSSRQTSSAM
jgi:putative membrane protein